MAVPLVMGSMTAAGLLVGQLLPTLERSRVLNDRLMQVRAQEQQLPAMRQRFRAATQELHAARNRQAVLLDLIAGADRIQTFLALVDQLARASAVEVVRFEPLEERSAEASEQRSAAEQRQEPMRALGYRKTSIAMQVFGSYGNLHRFLKGMESLETLVESSDLTLTSRPSDPKDQRKLMTTQLSIRLSFYDRLPSEEGEKDAV